MARPGAVCHQDTAAQGLSIPLANLIAPVVVVAHNRAQYLARCILTLLRYWHEDPYNEVKFPIYISVDGEDHHTLLFSSILSRASNVQVIHNLQDEAVCRAHGGYCHLSQHYKMLLRLFFECHSAPRLIFIEEDLEVSPDFFSYFQATATLLDTDKSLLCVSAWNDHGQQGRAGNVTALYRTDVMPGLGWMVTSAVGRELLLTWPRLYWDDWLREPTVRRGRQCIFPEVPRTHTYGKVGTSGGQHYTLHLQAMLLSTERIKWAAKDLSYLQEARYKTLMQQWLASAKLLTMRPDELRIFCHAGSLTQKQELSNTSSHDYIMCFSTLDEYMELAKALAPMVPDIKGNTGRASYDGVVIIRCRGHRLFLSPLVRESKETIGCSGKHNRLSS